MPHKNCLEIWNRLLIAALLGGVVALATVTASQAGETYKGTGTQTNMQQANMQQASLVAPSVRQTREAVDESSLGRAPYVCTPSGFGMRAQCFVRVSARTDR